jgi:hypothetical protein
MFQNLGLCNYTVVNAPQNPTYRDVGYSQPRVSGLTTQHDTVNAVSDRTATGGILHARAVTLVSGNGRAVAGASSGALGCAPALNGMV